MLPCGDYTIWSTFIPANFTVIIWKLPINSVWNEKAYEQFKSSLKLSGKDVGVNQDWDLTIQNIKFSYVFHFKIMQYVLTKQEGTVDHFI